MMLLDLYMIALNVVLDWCYIAHFPLEMKHMGLSEQTVGFLFLIRAISYVIACILIPYLRIPPKYKHTIGIMI